MTDGGEGEGEGDGIILIIMGEGADVMFLSIP